MASLVQSPEKELRFTRSGQATAFWISAAVLAAVGVTLLVTGLTTIYYQEFNPLVPHAAWSLIPFGLAVVLVKLAMGMTRHAYLILTPLGIEIFPFFRPADGMRLVTWQEVAGAEVNPAETLLTLHHNTEKTAGIHLSLKPIRADRRTLLAKAILGRLSPPAQPGPSDGTSHGS